MKPLYSISSNVGVKSFNDKQSLCDWASGNRGVGPIQVYGYSASMDCYVWLQQVEL